MGLTEIYIYIHVINTHWTQLDKLTLIADKVVPSGLALIDYQLVSMLTLIADELPSELTLIAKDDWIVPGLILDKDLRVQYLLHMYQS